MRALAVLLVALLAGCSQPAPTPATPTASSAGALTLVSDFQNGATIPKQHTCDGDGSAPTLNFTGAPAGAATLALIVIDPDVPVPQAPTQTITHWTAWNVPLVDGAVSIADGKVPAGAKEGINSGSTNGWMPPCPPVGSPAHRYMFQAYAVQGGIDLPSGASRQQLEGALQGKTLGNATLVWLYARAVLPG